MKEKELREAATCVACGNKIGQTGLPMFWRVTVERHGLKADAISRQTGLSMMLGSPTLAMHMGADEEMTEHLMEPVTVTVCEGCAGTATIYEIGLRDD